jgi:hypothetical protein
MGTHLGLAGLVSAMLLLAACGGGGGSDLALAGPTSDGPSSEAQQANLVVIRHDHDGDTHLDLLTLDASARPMVIVEALRGTPEGELQDGIESWSGTPIDPELSDAIQAYLADSFQVGAETDLDVTLGGETVTITVLE